MSQLVEVEFKGNRKEFFLWDGEEAPAVRTPVIVEADRGEDLGRVYATGDKARLRCEKCSHGLGQESPTRKVLRTASGDDQKRATDLRSQDEDARRKAMEQVRKHQLVMKLSDAEWQWDRRKLTIYFTAEKRVDFRNLVRDLASTFRARIELKQIGVRDEARRLDGIGRCGRQYCSASWLPELRPVSLGVAKDQRLSLNPSQISGACGRLMCCLRYEHEFYVQSRKRFPKEGKTLVTTKGEERVVSNDIFRERVTLRNAEGEFRTVELLDLRAEIKSRESPARAGEPQSADWTKLSGRVLPQAQHAELEPDVVLGEDVEGESADPLDVEGIPIETGEYRAMIKAQKEREDAVEREARHRPEQDRDRDTNTGEHPARMPGGERSRREPDDRSDVRSDSTRLRPPTESGGGIAQGQAADRAEEKSEGQGGADGADDRPRRRRGRRGGRRARKRDDRGKKDGGNGNK